MRFVAKYCRLRSAFQEQQGFALPLAMGLGFVMLTIGATTVLVAQGGRNTSVQRRDSGATFATAEGGISRTLAQLTQAQNSVLLNRNYDTINPETGTTYLGPDGVLNSGDEESAAIDNWTGYDPSGQACFQQKGWAAPNINLAGSIGAGDYELKAYRYDPKKQQGTVLVESSERGVSSAVAVTFSITPELNKFPGIVIIDPSRGNNTSRPGALALRGREIQGNNSNVYYSPPSSADPSLTGKGEPGARPNYLNAIWSSTTEDGAAGDTVAGTIFACPLVPGIPSDIRGTNLGAINTSRTLKGFGGGGPTLYQVERINLAGNDVLTVDTTDGPVQIDFLDIDDTSFVPEALTLHDTAKILNVRTDGQPPRVGDLRIMISNNQRIVLHDLSCIQDAFVWSWADEIRLLTSGPGCPSGRNTNFEGVAWVEAILTAKNDAGNRNVNYLYQQIQDYDTTVYPGVTSGIYVPDDVSSLSDLLPYIDWPARYRFGAVQNWQRVRL